MTVDELLDFRSFVVPGAGIVQLGEYILVVEQRFHGPAQHRPEKQIADGLLAPTVVDEPHLVAELLEVAFQREGLEYAAVVGMEREGQKGNFHFGCL